jgi:hypothetical protein
MQELSSLNPTSMLNTLLLLSWVRMAFLKRVVSCAVALSLVFAQSSSIELQIEPI